MAELESSLLSNSSFRTSALQELSVWSQHREVRVGTLTPEPGGSS